MLPNELEEFVTYSFQHPSGYLFKETTVATIIML